MICLKTIDLSSLEVDGIDHSDHPDYCDAYFSKGKFLDGKELSDDELIELTDAYPFTLHDLVFNTIY
jgi:hypothetical protein